MEYVILAIVIIVILSLVRYFNGRKIESDYRNSREFHNRRNDFKKLIDKTKKGK